MKKTKTYDREIEELRMLRAKKLVNPEYKEKYREKMEFIENNFGLSKKSIYRDIRKKNPSVRKIRTDKNKIKSKPDKKESVMILEAIKSGKTLEKARQVVEEITGKKVSYVKSKRIDVDGADIKESSYGNEFRKAIEKMFKYELIAPEKEIEIKLGGYKFTITKEDAGDIIMILTNAYNRWQKHNELDLPLDRDLLREHMLMHLFEEQLRIAQDQRDLKNVELLTRIYERMRSDFNMNSDFAVFEKCMRELKPGITREEVISIIKRNSQLSSS